MIISQNELDRILSKLDSENYWYNELGREVYRRKPKQGPKAAYNFSQIGKQKYRWAQKRLYPLFCSHGSPKKNLGMLIEGDQRDVAQAIFTAIFIHLETTIAIATPLTALVVRHGLLFLCKNSPENPRNKKTAKVGNKKIK